MVESPTFSDSWVRLIRKLGTSFAAAEEGAADDPQSLRLRVERMRQRADSRRVLVDCLALATERCYVEQGLRLLSSVCAIEPGSELPFDAATLVRVSQQFPGQSARQVRAFVLESAPSSEPGVNGRFDRLQAARLYMGTIQFGYFISQVFRGQEALGGDERVLSPAEARAVQELIQRSTREMRSEAAWAAASRRAGTLFALPSDDLAEDVDVTASLSAGGFEQLREFTAGVQVVSSTQQDEFFQPPPDSGGSNRDVDNSSSSVVPPPPPQDPVAADTSSALPQADFVRFNAAGLQAVLAEGCLYGWHLWGAELGAREQLESWVSSDGEDAASILLTQPER